MPQSIQVHWFDTPKSEARIMDALKKESARGGSGGQHPRLQSVDRTGGNVTGLLRVQADGETLRCEFALRPSDGRLVLAGASRARSLAAEFLAQTIEGRPRARVVQARRLTVGQMLRLFNDIARLDRRNILDRLALRFEPQIGRQYKQETYTLIEYSFVENRCASEHRDFRGLCKDAKEMEMRLRVRTCAGVAPEPDGQRRHAMVARPECAFRMYRDIPLADWLRFCDKMSFVFDEAGG